ncbi:thioredoxin family protein [Archangium lipolyticum]|uniref:thioredoxin family protein n=1 Tax=Archangium lipolyticum TaxID=2970465 RepID=UPI002149BF60|nr:thioredoxin family protein [Archangium lipolyticum]
MSSSIVSGRLVCPRFLFVVFFSSVLSWGCATTTAPHGTLSDLSAARGPATEFCAHRVPAEACTRCHPELQARFKAVGDWCAPHGVPESQCFVCHPDLSFEPLPTLSAEADLRQVAEKGEDVPSLEAHLVPGKVTVFDFYADWCTVCREVDRHVFALLNRRSDVAYVKLNVVSWETPLARRYLSNAPGLPLLVVYGKDGGKVATLSGGDTQALDKAIAEGAAR